MKEPAIDPDSIGSPEPLTTAEAAALAAYFAAKKVKVHKPIHRPAVLVASQQKTTS